MRTADELRVALHTVDGVPVAAVRGEVDLETKDRFERELEPVRGGEGPAVLDLAEVPFMDSTGLHVVVRLWQKLREDGRTLVVACGPQGVRKLFELTGLDRMMPVYEDAASAAAAVGGREPGLSEQGS